MQHVSSGNQTRDLEVTVCDIRLDTFSYRDPCVILHVRNLQNDHLCKLFLIKARFYQITNKRTKMICLHSFACFLYTTVFCFC